MTTCIVVSSPCFLKKIETSGDNSSPRRCWWRAGPALQTAAGAVQHRSQSTAGPCPRESHAPLAHTAQLSPDSDPDFPLWCAHLPSFSVSTTLLTAVPGTRNLCEMVERRYVFPAQQCDIVECYIFWAMDRAFINYLVKRVVLEELLLQSMLILSRDFITIEKDLG